MEIIEVFSRFSTNNVKYRLDYRTSKIVRLLCLQIENLFLKIESIDNCLLKTHFKEHENEKMETFYYNCDCSSIQSIIFFGLHWTNTYSNEIYLSKNIFESHLHSKKFSIDGKFYLFAVQIAKNNDEKDFLLLKTDDISLTLPVHLIVYRANI